MLNDFAIVNSQSNIREQLLLLRVLRDSALVDGFGAQAHTFNLDNMQANDLKQNIDLMATAGVPIYITEMDIQGTDTDEASQLQSYQELFPVLWEHPDVTGITLWGYIYGDMWKPDAGLVHDNGRERSSMGWLKNYMGQQEDVGYPFGAEIILSAEPTSPASKENVRVYPNPTNGEVTLRNTSNKPEHISIYDIYGRLADSFKLHPNSKAKHNLSAGIYLIIINNQDSIKLLVNE